MHSSVGDTQGSAYRFGPRYWTMDKQEVLAKAEAGQFDSRSWVGGTGPKELAAYRAARAAAKAISAQMVPLDDEYLARGGWTRAYLATSTNGHIHSSTGCSTCRATTTYYWFTDLSGHDEAEIVAKAGSDACTVCYPTAPVNDRKRPRSIFSDDELAAQAAREERAAAKAEREAKKLAKALLPTGEAVRIRTASGFREDVTTLAAAKKVLTDAYEYQILGYSGHAEWLTGGDARVLATAIAQKEGISTNEVLTQAEKRAARRR